MFKQVPLHCALILLIFGIFWLPSSAQAQEEARFGYTVATTTAEFEIFSPSNDLYYYGWSFDGPCDGSACYEKYSEGSSMDNPLLIDNMRDYAGSGATETEVFLEVYDQSGENLVADKAVTISLGSGVNYGDSDGDGILDDEENTGCENDPDPNCGEGGGGDDDGGGGEDGGDGTTAGLVNCGNPGADGELQDSEMCGYGDLINLISILINWLIGILILVATLLFTYAGFLYLAADGNSNQAQQAKSIFTNVAVGFSIVLLSVLLVTTLVTMFTSSGWENNWIDAVPLPDISAEIDDPGSRDNRLT